jgi:hypothetical protein
MFVATKSLCGETKGKAESQTEAKFASVSMLRPGVQQDSDAC